MHPATRQAGRAAQRGRRPSRGQLPTGARPPRARDRPDGDPSGGPPGGDPVATKAPAQTAAAGATSRASSASLTPSPPAQVGQRRLADPGHLAQLVDRAEPAVRRPPVEDPLRQHRTDARAARPATRGSRCSGRPGRPAPMPRRRHRRPCPVRRATAVPLRDWTTTCSPSTSTRARLTLAARAAAVVPPAATTASATRDPAGSRTRPGRCTAPTTWTTTSAGAVVAPGRSTCGRDVAGVAPRPRRDARAASAEGWACQHQQHRHQHGDQQDDCHPHAPRGGPGPTGPGPARGRVGSRLAGRRPAARHPATQRPRRVSCPAGPAAGTRRRRTGPAVGVARVACSHLDARKAGPARGRRPQPVDDRAS